jgi:hypothetical protein
VKLPATITARAVTPPTLVAGAAPTASNAQSANTAAALASSGKPVHASSLAYPLANHLVIMRAICITHAHGISIKPITLSHPKRLTSSYLDQNKGA